MTQPQEASETEHEELKGLDGWLLLVGLSVIVTPIRILRMLDETYTPIFSERRLASHK